MPSLVYCSVGLIQNETTLMIFKSTPIWPDLGNPFYQGHEWSSEREFDFSKGFTNTKHNTNRNQITNNIICATHVSQFNVVAILYSSLFRACRGNLIFFSVLFPLQSFQGSQGRAYLFNSVVNVGCGPAEERVLLTGLHAVADIYCENCKTTLGWKYEHAFESSQKYKEGKFIIELAHMIKDNGWD
ncbi:protein yippee-like 2 isoform X1 [Myxocyprinus asiaticus]|uniref:protein yippee-like 2 isoform X1 n=1 Tax=Myxocyprinus asiaticus TaxID=70543 RepID=UPI00222199F2|nr:protein yippee-like 2 isoform X1 [Myxocyprinus asiaticus]